MTDFEAWARACRKLDRGKIFLDNLGIDLDLSEVSDGAIRLFRNSLGTGSSMLSTEPVSDAIDRSISAASLYLKGRRKNRSGKALACVFRFDWPLALRWLDLTPISGWNPYDGPEEILSKVQSAGGLSSLIRSGAELRGAAPMVWLTFDDEITGLLRSGTYQADEIRDTLGLLHHNQDVFLCRILIPSERAVKVIKRRPTAFDSGANLVFRSNELSENTGRTLHLQSGLPAVREMVSAPISLASSFELTPIGRLGATAGFSWRSLAAKTKPARITRTLNRIRKAL